MENFYGIWMIYSDPHFFINVESLRSHPNIFPLKSSEIFPSRMGREDTFSLNRKAMLWGSKIWDEGCGERP